MNYDRYNIPLPLAFHLAIYSVVGLFCGVAGALNLIDPGHILPWAVPFFLIAGFSWGYVFGIVMGRKEAYGLGFLASAAYAAAGIWQWSHDWRLGALLLGIGLVGFYALLACRRNILSV